MKRVLKRAPSLRGKLTVPADKSITHRAILFSALANGVSIIKNPLLADDCLSTARCVEGLGVRIKKSKGLWRIKGRGHQNFLKPREPLYCGNSGTTMRLLSGVLAAQPFSTVLTGDGSLSNRPMDRVARPLTKMGARITLTREKFAPLTIHGGAPLHPIIWKNPVASAQVKSCVLLAGLGINGKTTFIEPSLSRDHTERMLTVMGARLTRKGPRVTIEGHTPLKPQCWVVPGDFSSAAFFLAAGLLVPGSQLELKSLNLNPTRTGFLTILRRMGAHITVREKLLGGEPYGSLTITHQHFLHACRLNPAEVPNLIDEIPILAVVATQAHGRSILRGIEELRVKETDRVTAMATNLKKMGARIIEKKDALLIDGPSPLRGAVVNSYGDHRIAMSLAIAALIADGSTTIRGAECVSISFPRFWTTLQHLIHDR